MNRRITIVAGGAAALLVAGGLIVAAQQGTSRTDAGARVQTPSTSAPSAPAPTAAGPIGGQDEPDTSTPVPAPDGVPDDHAATPGPGNGDPGTRYSTEVLPPAGQPTASLPQSKPPPVLVSLPLPASNSAEGDLVDGFPTTAIGTAPGSTISGSSVSSEGARLQATLTARSTLTGTDVLGYYRTAFAQLGLYDVAAPAAAGSSALAFTRDENSVTITVTERAGGCSYEIFASFTAAS